MSQKDFAKISVFLSLGTMLLASCGQSASSSDVSKDITDDSSLTSQSPVVDDRKLNDFAYTLNSLTGTDAFGRTFRATKKENGKEVGLFYFLWHGTHETGIYDITQLLKYSPDEPLDPAGSSASPVGVFHKWGKPLYGYYNSADPFVIARHLELFVQAGIDYIVFDTTNSVTYNNVVIALSNIFLTYQKQGWKVPKVAFYCNSSSGRTVENIYSFYYQEHPEFEPLWYTIEDRPMIVANTADFTDEQYQRFDGFFYLKEAQWPDQSPKLNQGFPWQEWTYPQNNYRGTMSVSVAQGPGYNMADPISSWGRGFDFSSMQEDSSRFAEGLNLESQWKSAISPDEETGEVKNVFVSTWNEWMAIKQVSNDKVIFCDEYNEEYSRDCEMEDGLLGDNFYLQLARNIRAFKFEAAPRYLYPETAIDEHNLSSWDAIEHNYLDFAGDAMVRNYRDCVKDGTGVYQDNSARNDITKIKVAHDANNLYFYVETKDAITIPDATDTKWMNLLLNSYQDDEKFGNNYDFRLNRSRDGTHCSVEKFENNDWTKVGECNYVVSSSVITFALPLSLIGKTKDDVHVAFKAMDNVTKDNDIMDYYVTGDSAPLGRMSYEYGY